MTKVAVLTAVLAAGFLAGAVPPLTQAGDPASGTTTTVVVTRTVQGRYQGWTARTWARKNAQHLRDSLKRGRTIARLKRVQHRRWAPIAAEIVPLAAIAYGQSSSTLLRKGACESHWNPFALNPSGAGGWFQFLPSTWATTPFSGYSRFDPLASALAASWMHSRGRGNEWSCR